MRAIITQQKTSGEIKCLVIPSSVEFLSPNQEIISEMTAPKIANTKEVQKLIFEAFRLGAQWGRQNPS